MRFGWAKIWFMKRENALDFGVWLARHAAVVKKYAGQWIALNKSTGLIGSSEDAQELYRKAQKKYPKDVPFLYKVPRPDEGPYVL